MTSIEIGSLPPLMQLGIERAVRCLRMGGVVAFATDTLYGLGANVFDTAALDKLFEIKERPSGLALPVLIDGWDQLQMVADDVPGSAKALGERFWPGSLTLVVNKSPRVPGRLTADGTTVAVRMPDHPVPRAIARRLGRPITGTSANISGRANPGTLDELREQLEGRLDYIVDFGPAPGGVASTVVDITRGPPVLVREGAVPFSEITKII